MSEVLYKSPSLIIQAKDVDGVTAYRVCERSRGVDIGKDCYDSLDVFRLMLKELRRVNPKATRQESES